MGWICRRKSTACEAGGGKAPRSGTTDSAPGNSIAKCITQATSTPPSADHRKGQPPARFRPADLSEHVRMPPLMSVKQARVNVGSMNRRVATRTPTRTHSQPIRVIHLPDEDPPGCHPGSWGLQMAFQTEMVVPFRQQRRVRRTVRLMTYRAALAQGLVFEHHGPALPRMAARTGLVQTCPAKPTRRLGHVHPVRIMAGTTGHAPLQHRMAGGKPELTLHFEMTLQTNPRLAVRIPDKPPSPPSSRHMQTSRPVTRLACSGVVRAGHHQVHAGMRIQRECACILSVTIQTHRITHEGRPLDGRWPYHSHRPW